jgi:hypothetical protein
MPTSEPAKSMVIYSSKVTPIPTWTALVGFSIPASWHKRMPVSTRTRSEGLRPMPQGYGAWILATDLKPARSHQG